MSITCERCGGRGPQATSGPFAGSYADVFYCRDCSKNLCDDCLANGKCFESESGKHTADWCDTCENFLDDCECEQAEAANGSQA